MLGKNHKGLDVWRNVSEHCLVQTAASGVLAEALGLPKEKKNKVELAAMTHDWDKKYQSQGLRKINEKIESGEISEEKGGKLKYDFFEESEEHNLKGMRDRGVPENLIKLALTDGHPSLPRMREADCTLEEKLVHYVGSVTNESDIVPLDTRIDNLKKILVIK